jgi:arsenate reductase-like glutaredoxin family protein
MTCTKTQEFLAKNKVTVTQSVDAKKSTIVGVDALSVLENIDELIVVKGKKIVRFSLKKDRPADVELLAVLLGPTGNLRAPTFRMGRKLGVGFDEKTYTEIFRL